MSPSAPRSGSTPAARTRARRGDGELLRDEILDATEALLLSQGTMDGVSIRAVARAVGVTPPSLYLHFTDKDDLFFAVCERRFAAFDDVLRAAGEGHDDPVEQLRAMGRAYIAYGIANAEHYQLLFGPRAHELHRDRDLSDSPGTRAFSRLVDTIAAGMAAGSLREEDPMVAAFSVWSAVHGTVMLLLTTDAVPSTGEPLPEMSTLAAACCDTLLLGLARR